MKRIDLSHDIEAGMVTYKGLPGPIICDYLSREASRSLYAPGTEFQIGRVEMVSNTGTYIDCPFHRFADGDDLARAPLDHMAGLDGVVLRAEGLSAVDVEAFDLNNKAVLIHTGWDRHWRTDAYFEGHPFVTEAAARFLVKEGARLVGIDSHNIDDTTARDRPVHTVLLGAGVLIVEHMTGLSRLPESGFRFYAVPPKVAGMGTFPVRAFAEVD